MIIPRDYTYKIVWTNFTSKTFDPVRSKTFSLKDQTFCVNGDNEMSRDLHKWG